MPKVVLTQDAV